MTEINLRHYHYLRCIEVRRCGLQYLLDFLKWPSYSPNYALCPPSSNAKSGKYNDQHRMTQSHFHHHQWWMQLEDHWPIRLGSQQASLWYTRTRNMLLHCTPKRVLLFSLILLQISWLYFKMQASKLLLKPFMAFKNYKAQTKLTYFHRKRSILILYL